jgi:tripartite-type tricarboxylate transporter receptor subunit TctC
MNILRQLINNRKSRLSNVLTVLGLFISLTAVHTSFSQPATTYPTQPIKIVVPFPPGGATDIIARIIGQKMSERMGVSVIIENKAGANGNIASEAVSRAAADGYTLLYNTSSLALSPALYKNLTFDTQKDLAPVILTTVVPMLLAVNPSVPVNNVMELAALLKSKPGLITFGSAGIGNITHLAPLLMMDQLGVTANHIPYKGSAPSVMAVVAGEVQFDMEPMAVGLQFAKEGRLKPLAVTTLQRSPALPNVPTLDESGMKGFEVGAWQGIMAPGKTPPAIISRLNTEITQIIALPEIKEKLLSHGAQVLGSTPEQYASYLDAEIKRWDKVVKESNTKPE